MTIDLDVAPTGTRAGGRRTRFDLLAVVASVLVLVGASTPPTYAGELEPVLEGDGRSISAGLVTGSAIYTQHSLTVGGASDIWARPLRPGGPEWITQVRGSGTGLWLDASQTVLVSEAGDAGETTFLDARTGRVLWRTAEYATVRDLGSGVTDWQQGGRLRIREVATGRIRWSAPATAFAGDPAHRYVVTFDEQNRATVLAAADGRVVTGPRRLGVEWGLDFPPPLAPARVIGDLLVVFGAAFVAAFRIGDLTPRWRTTTDRPFELRGCGDQICAFSSGGLAVLDRGTGTVRWTSARWRGLAPDGETLLDEAGRAARVDLATGHVDRDLGEGSVVGGLLLVEGDGERTLVRRVSDGRVLGTVERVPQGACAAGGGFLACRTFDARFRVWRLP
ncbi:outer membrane protein assembly factor BamB family protein [Paractinoplanes maris]|uniref:outer membrane protein assembly factor BamB family protein n=1 Tax=Paractinoplanes maris TaxID=1734446 RepID=UPI0020218DBA|nr:PQQ-binding-like beta-propeller repeat protein [Actinoplanes maris]